VTGHTAFKLASDNVGTFTHAPFMQIFTRMVAKGFIHQSYFCLEKFTSNLIPRTPHYVPYLPENNPRFPGVPGTLTFLFTQQNTIVSVCRQLNFTIKIYKTLQPGVFAN
jgi:hypothetical protein